jgi:DNA-binding MarR family transcriptional regulator
MEPTASRAEAPARRRADSAALYKGLAGFRRELRKFLAFSEAVLQSAGITSQQYQAMLAIGASDAAAMSMKELARELLLKPNGAVQLIDRLEGLGLVSRAGSEGDRRQVQLTLTPDGEARVRTLARQHRAELIRHKQLLVESLERLERFPQ